MIKYHNVNIPEAFRCLCSSSICDIDDISNDVASKSNLENLKVYYKVLNLYTIAKFCTLSLWYIKNKSLSADVKHIPVHIHLCIFFHYTYLKENRRRYATRRLHSIVLHTHEKTTNTVYITKPSFARNTKHQHRFILL